jgi:hypothetical protein
MRRRDKDTPGSQHDAATGNINATGEPIWFAAMEYHSLILNRTYKVFLTDQLLVGAAVRGGSGQSPDHDIIDVETGILGADSN